eukprot:2398538-Amphidinium_carterae.1
MELMSRRQTAIKWWLSCKLTDSCCHIPLGKRYQIKIHRQKGRDFGAGPPPRDTPLPQIYAECNGVKFDHLRRWITTFQQVASRTAKSKINFSGLHNAQETLGCRQAEASVQ